MPLRGLTKRDVLADFRRAELIDAANAVFARKGFAGASVDEIAKMAGVAKGTVYLYYPSKHDIYWAVLESGIVALDKAIREAVGAAPRSLKAQLLAVAQTKLAYFDERRDFFRIFFSELGSQACEVSTASAAAPALSRARALRRAARRGGDGAPRDSPAARRRAWRSPSPIWRAASFAAGSSTR